MFTIFSDKWFINFPCNSTCISSFSCFRHSISTYIWRMYITAIDTTFYMNIISCHHTYDTANIANRIRFVSAIRCLLGGKTFIIYTTSSRNITSIILSILDSIYVVIATISIIASHTTYIHGTANISFLIGHIDHIGIFCTTSYTTYIACLISFRIWMCFIYIRFIYSGCNISLIKCILDGAIRNGTDNTTNISHMDG